MDVPPGVSLPGYYRISRDVGRLLRAVERCPLPVIAAVNGLAVCGGFELLLACDMAVVADDAVVGDQHVKFGLHPGGGSTHRLPRLVGRQRAMWHLIGADYIPPRTLVEWGLAVDVVPRAAVVDRALEVAAVVARRRAHTVAAVKRSVGRSGRPWAAALERLACVRNGRRLGSEGTELRVKRFEEVARLVTPTNE
jgi:enoyl-CoA hydratase/carnithine racemase